jgi:MoxR-like ATPase
MKSTKDILKAAADGLKHQSAQPSGFDNLVTTIEAYTKAGLNIMLMGRHGVGKTAAIRAAAQNLKMKMAYWSAPLMDPDIDLGGIPVPNKKTGSLDFFRNPELDSVEIIFLDELNRASPRTLNMVFELVQFKSVHGKVLPNLKCVHTGINPPGAGAYDVQQLDDALLDRFHAFLTVEPEFPTSIIMPILGEAKTAAMLTWYTRLDSSKYVAPRRLEYAAKLHALGMPMAHAFLDGALPVGALEAALGRAELTRARIETAAPAAKIPWSDAEDQAVLNNPDLKELNEAFTKYLSENGISSEQLWEKVLELRAMEGVVNESK